MVKIQCDSNGVMSRPLTDDEQHFVQYLKFNYNGDNCRYGFGDGDFETPEWLYFKAIDDAAALANANTEPAKINISNIDLSTLTTDESNQLTDVIIATMTSDQLAQLKTKLGL